MGRHGGNHILYPTQALNDCRARVSPRRRSSAGPPTRADLTRIEGPPIAQRPSSHAYLAWLLYAAAVVYATLYPLSGWRLIGVGAFSFLSDPWPRYWTWFDFLTNIAAYLPLGVFGFVWLRRHMAPAFAVAVAIAAGVVLSLLLEAAQTLLPDRVPSRADWLANSIGAIAGAMAVAAFGRWRRRPGPASLQWSPDAGLTIALLVVWLIVQCRPQQLLFATGHWLDAWLTWAPDLGEPALDQAIRRAQALIAQARIDERFATFAEACAVAANMVAIGLLAMRLVRPAGPRLLVAGIVIGAGMAASLVTGAVLIGDPGWLWSLSPGNQGGLVIGLIGLLMLGWTSDGLALAIAAVLIVVAAILVNLVPENAYFASTVERWDPGALRNLDAVNRAAAVAWPAAALVFCVAGLLRRRRMRRL